MALDLEIRKLVGRAELGELALELDNLLVKAITPLELHRELCLVNPQPLVRLPAP